MFKNTIIRRRILPAIRGVTIALIVVSVVTACGGRNARPIQVVDPNDEQRNCQALLAEMTMIESEVSKLGGYDKSKNTKNAFFGVTGIFLYVPLLFMDLSDAEKEEMTALRDRYRRLAVIAINKGCDPKRPVAPAQ